MKCDIARASFVAGIILASGARGEPAARTVFEIAQDIQSFYPVGSVRADIGTLDFYVMAGFSASGARAQHQLSVVLINQATGAGEHIQIVELQSLTCGSRSLKPTFRLLLNSKGQNITPPVPAVPIGGGNSGTLLTPDAVRKTVAILCDGVVPKNELENRSLADFR